MPNTLALNLSLRPESPVKIFPIGLAYVLSGLKRAGYDFELFDIDNNRYSEEVISKKLSERRWDVVLMGCIVTGYNIVKKLAAKIRRHSPDALIVVGNSVASSIPKILLNKTEANVAVIGEGDKTVVDILLSGKNLQYVEGIYFKENGKAYKTSYREVIPDINTIKPPVYAIFDVEEYILAHKTMIPDPLPMDRDSIRAFPINTARGCINRCTFCYHCFINEKYRYRSAKSIVDEIKLLKSLYAINYIFLWDDLTFFSKRQTEEFVDLVLKEKLEVYWMGDVRGNLFQTEKDLDLLKKVKDSGCMNLGYSLESADEKILKDMKKNVSIQQFKQQKELLDKAGITSKTSIVLGYPRETPDTIAKTYQFCLDMGIYPSTGYLLPQPMTPVYEWAKENGYIQDDEEYLMGMGDRQDLRINLTKMNDQEFLGEIDYWTKKLNMELAIGLEEDQLIKTQFYRASNN